MAELWLIFLFPALGSLVLIFNAERNGGSDGVEEPEEELRREEVFAVTSGL